MTWREPPRWYWAAALGLAALGLVLGACTRLGAPTLLPLPKGATDPGYEQSADGRVYQVDFTLEAAYPDDRAALHYEQLLSRPWLRCERMPRWQSHLERGGTVHQQAHAWINRDARRAILVNLRYFTEGVAKQPAYPYQHVVVLEHIGIDVDAEVRVQRLACPSSR